MKSFSGAGILFFAYFLLLALCGYLNFFHQKPDIATLAVNIGMFLIVGFIILWAIFQCFHPVSKMAGSLRYTMQTMEIDFNEKETYLWEEYRNETKLFGNKILDARFNEYRVERKRLNLLSEGAKCDIEDYINDYFIDAHMKKGVVSIIPGVMTGLGILGTFIGLAFGLQNFNTGSAAEITSSIAPLMDGIKIAFHTSIYGMVFSLIFNFVYKKCLEDAYQAVDDFLEQYHKYVLPKAEDNQLNLLMAFQEKQMQQMEMLLERFSNRMANQIVDALTMPQGFSGSTQATTPTTSESSATFTTSEQPPSQQVSSSAEAGFGEEAFQWYDNN